MTKLQITTPYGKRYIVHENGNIERTDMKFRPSDSWRMLGLQHVKRREFIPLAQVEAALERIELRYKNGNPQWTVRDYDNGTTREWGNTKVHGVSNIRVI